MPVLFYYKVLGCICQIGIGIFVTISQLFEKGTAEKQSPGDYLFFSRSRISVSSTSSALGAGGSGSLTASSSFFLPMAAS